MDNITRRNKEVKLLNELKSNINITKINSTDNKNILIATTGSIHKITELANKNKKLITEQNTQEFIRLIQLSGYNAIKIEIINIQLHKKNYTKRTTQKEKRKKNSTIYIKPNKDEIIENATNKALNFRYIKKHNKNELNKFNELKQLCIKSQFEHEYTKGPLFYTLHGLIEHNYTEEKGLKGIAVIYTIKKHGFIDLSFIGRLKDYKKNEQNNYKATLCVKLQ